MPPTRANGKICYVELPAADVPRSVAFYEAVFGWTIRRRGDGQAAFDDGVGEVSGTWVVGPPPSREPGLLLYIMVDSVAATIDAVVAMGVNSCNQSVSMHPRDGLPDIAVARSDAPSAVYFADPPSKVR